MSQITEPVQELAPGVIAVIDWDEATMYLDLYPEAGLEEFADVLAGLAVQGVELIPPDEAPTEEQEDGAVRYWLAPIEIQEGDAWS